MTQGQWKALMGTEPWKDRGNTKEGADYPATYVSHGLNADGTVERDSATEFCRKLSTKEGVEYRLPSEAEWEYACRAGSSTAYSFGDNAASLGDYAWFDENAYDIDEKYAHRVGQKRANAFGLYDMHGNVVEWCGDWSGEDYYKASPLADPRGPSSGSFRVFRGGCWSHSAQIARSADRDWNSPGLRTFSVGFRVLRSSVLSSK